jgi:hypothetical protein
MLQQREHFLSSWSTQDYVFQYFPDPQYAQKAQMEITRLLGKASAGICESIQQDLWL